MDIIGQNILNYVVRGEVRSYPQLALGVIFSSSL